MDARIKTAWPLFALRIRSERLVLRLPKDDELVALMTLAKAGIHPAGEMPFGVPWSILPSPGFERGFLQYHWLMRATWKPEDWWLNLMVERDGDLIGSQSLHAEHFAITRTVETGSWLGHAYQGRGFGKEMRAAILAFAFDQLGAHVATTEAFLDNGASNGVSRSLGYQENGFGSLAPEGIARDTRRFRLTAKEWQARQRAPITVDGLAACRDLFGATRASKSEKPGVEAPRKR